MDYRLGTVPGNRLWIKRIEANTPGGVFQGGIKVYADGELVKTIGGEGRHYAGISYVWVNLKGTNRHVTIEGYGYQAVKLKGVYSILMRTEESYFIEWRYYGDKTGQLLWVKNEPAVSVTVKPPEDKRLKAFYVAVFNFKIISKTPATLTN